MAFASINQTSVGGGSSNALSIQSDGIFMPRLSTAQRTALALTTSDTGLTVYDFTLNNLFIWNGTAWESIPGSGDAGANGSVQYNDNGIVSGATNFVWDKVNGRVGIGVPVPLSTVQSAGTVSVTGGAATGAANGLHIRFDTAINTGYISAYHAGVDNRDLIYDAKTHVWLLAAAGASLTLNSTANLVLRGGTAAANGVGVTFPAVQVASSDANCLDDYEEGTWVPTQGAGLTVVGTFSSSGTYTKVGRLVTITGSVDGSTSVAAAASGIVCNALPFSSAQQVTATAVNSPFNAGAFCAINVTSFYAITAIGATTAIRFSATYSV